MLEFNEKHKKVDLSHVNSNSGRYKRSSKVVLAGILLSTVILFSGCSDKVDKPLSLDLNRAMISIGNECVVVDINGYARWDRSNTTLELTDGTTIIGHPSDINLYNSNNSGDRIFWLTCKAF